MRLEMKILADVGLLGAGCPNNSCQEFYGGPNPNPWVCGVEMGLETEC